MTDFPVNELDEKIIKTNIDGFTGLFHKRLMPSQISAGGYINMKI